MAWYGKVGGGILGFLAAGPVGAFVGAALGHQFDVGTATTRRPEPAWRGPGQQSSADRQRLFFETTFLALGHLAKADGRVSEEEIGAARLVMHDLRLPPGDVRRAIDLFTTGKRPDFPIERQVMELRQACRGYPEILRTFLEIQVGFLLAKGGSNPRERELLLRMAGTLGVTGMDMAHLESVLRARRSFRENRSAADPARSLDGAYRALGIAPSASDQDVKTAYRRLMNQHHPDKQASRGLPDSMLEAAKDRTREIRAAYELIRERRGFS